MSGIAATGATRPNSGLDLPLGPLWPRYPDPAWEIIDPAFEKYYLNCAGVERIATGFSFCEGPVWFGDWRRLLWTDIPNDRILSWDEATARVDVFRQQSNFANGLTRDRQGRLIACEHLTRRVTRTEHDGTISILADRFNGRPLNSPNDVVVKSDGTVWFTDPPFGIVDDYEGRRAEPELPQNVYRLDPNTSGLDVVAGDVPGPNGLCFSPDERTLYVVASRAKPNRLIEAFSVTSDGESLDSRRTLIDCERGTADGIRCDEDGNLWCGWGMGSDDLDGVMIFSPSGKLIGRIRLPERCANLCFGGPTRNRLFMASSRSVYALHTGARGAVRR